MTRAIGSVEVHQTVHGYKDGHRLLSSSRDLDFETQRTLLVLSDLSGSSIVSGFESYLSAFPLPDVGLYALAKTWYAEEMPRPGCVWTHTLLVDFGDLAAIESLDLLAGYFRRPTVDSAESAYSRKVVISDLTSAPQKENRDLQGCREILAALYIRPTDPVIVSATTSHEFETAVLAVWSQQWPRLRRSLAFCTGALAPRLLGSRRFDLQVIPRPLRSSFVSQDSSSVDAAQFRGADDPRLDRLVEDLDGRLPRLRAFLWDFAIDLPTPRAQVFPLLDVFEAVQRLSSGVGQLSEVISTLALKYPAVSEAAVLKVELCGRVRELGRRYMAAEDPELLFEVISPSTHAAFDWAALEGELRLLAIAQRDPLFLARQAETVLAHPNSEIRAAVERALAQIESPHALKLIGDTVPNLLSRLVTVNPRLALSSAFWRAAGGQSQEILTAVLRHALATGASEFSRGLVFALLNALARVDPTPVFERLGQTACEALVDWQDSFGAAQKSIPGQAWVAHLGSCAAGLTARLRPTASTHVWSRALIVSSLSPALHTVNGVEGGDLVRLLDDLEHAPIPDREVETSTRAVCFVFAVRQSDAATARELIMRTFGPLHADAARSTFPQSAWSRLEPALPETAWWRRWDRCERLRRAVVSVCTRDRWAPQTILAVARDDETLHSLLTTFQESYAGGPFVQALVGLAAHDQTLTDGQRSVLRRFEPRSLWW